jgi:hypothetical protein
MSDVFISYASADRDRAKAIADALAEQGWSVWWDRTIPPGKEFDQVIEEALDAATCVVVLWSRASVASSWVKTEAAEAMRRKVLVPALIEDTRIPLEFRRLQAADLSQWQGESSHPEFEKFRQSIKENIQPTSPRPPPAPERSPSHRAYPSQQSEPEHPKSTKRNLILAAVAGLVVIGAAAGYSVYSDYVNMADLKARIRLEEARKQAERDRATEEAAAREAAQRKTDEDRRTSQQAAAPAKPARERTQRPVEEKSTYPSGNYIFTMEWRDHALRYDGTVKWSTSDANLKATVFDLGTGSRIGDYDVPGTVSKEGASDYIVSGDFSIPGDSVSPYPHSHTVRLTMRMQGGMPRFIQNCPRPGECYPASGSDESFTKQREAIDKYNENAKRVIQSIGR